MKPADLTHASFFSGVGGLDLGLERAGWTTVSLSEVDPYACAVLAERFPGIPSLGDITTIADRFPDDVQRARRLGGRGHDGTPADGEEPDGRHAADAPANAGGKAGRGEGTASLGGHEPDAGDGEWRRAVPSGSGEHPWPRGRGAGRDDDGWGESSPARGGWGIESRADGSHDWRDATLWSGGFPCQDLSLAGKRAGFRGERSILAFAFLDLVRAELVAGRGPDWLLLENVPGLLSSHGGADLARLACEVADLGFGLSYRILDSRHFHLAQRRRRVFLLATRTPGGRAGAERAAAVLADAASRVRHPAAGCEAGEGAAPGAGGGADIDGSLTRRYGKGINTTVNDGAVGTLATNAQSVDARYIVVGAPPHPDGMRAADGLARRLDDREQVAGFAQNQRGEVRLTGTVSSQLTTGGGKPGDPLLPPGLDSHRYRCCGNGVVAPVAEAIGRALAEEVWA